MPEDRFSSYTAHKFSIEFIIYSCRCFMNLDIHVHPISFKGFGKRLISSFWAQAHHMVINTLQIQDKGEIIGPELSFTLCLRSYAIECDF